MVERVQPSERVARRKLAPLFAACLFVALAGAQVKAPKPPRESAPEKSAQSHGTLPWFAGSYEELGRQSKEQQLQVVIFLWVDASRWCRRLETEALSDPKLAQALDGMLLWNGDAQRDAGKMWAERLGVSSFPVMIFCDSQGHPIERLDGYQPKEQFLTEVARVLRNEGTAPDLRRKLDQGPDDIELRSSYACKLEALGDFVGRDAQIEQLRKRDSRRTSLPLRREVYAERLAKIQEHFESTREINPGPLVRFLEEERHPELLFEGYMALAALHRQRADELELAQQLQAASSKRSDLRAILIKAALVVPKDLALQLEFAIQTVATFASLPAELSASDRAFLLPLSASAVALDPEEARAQACAAMASFLNGDKAAAAILLRRARELEPDNPNWPALTASLGL